MKSPATHICSCAQELSCQIVCERGLLFWGLLFIWFVYTVCLYSRLGLAKAYYGFRFERLLYGDFKKVVALAGGCTVTGALSGFLSRGKLWILNLKRVFWLIGWGRENGFIVITRGELAFYSLIVVSLSSIFLIIGYICRNSILPLPEKY
jgi:hypothetical protein